MPSDYDLERYAQMRTPWQWTKEKINPRLHLRKAVNRQYRKMVEGMVRWDKAIRQAVRESEDSLAMAEKRFGQAKFLDMAHYLWEMGVETEPVVKAWEEMKSLRTSEVAKFFAETDREGFKWENRDRYEKMAGLGDFVKDIVNPKRNVAKFMGEMMDERIGEVQKKLQGVLEAASSFHDTALGELRGMGDDRAVGDVGNYLRGLERIYKSRKAFVDSYQQAYTSVIAPWVAELQKSREPAVEPLPEAPLDPEVSPEGAPEEPTLVVEEAAATEVDPETEVDQTETETEAGPRVAATAGDAYRDVQPGIVAELPEWPGPAGKPFRKIIKDQIQDRAEEALTPDMVGSPELEIALRMGPLDGVPVDLEVGSATLKPWKGDPSVFYINRITDLLLRRRAEQEAAASAQELPLMALGAVRHAETQFIQEVIGAVVKQARTSGLSPDRVRDLLNRSAARLHAAGAHEQSRGFLDAASRYAG